MFFVMCDDDAKLGFFFWGGGRCMGGGMGVGGGVVVWCDGGGVRWLLLFEGWGGCVCEGKWLCVIDSRVCGFGCEKESG